VGYFTDRFYVYDVTSGVTDALKKTASVLWSISCKIRICGPVKLGDRHDVRAHLCDVAGAVTNRGGAGAHSYCWRPALQLSHPLFQDVDCRVIYPVAVKTRWVEVKNCTRWAAYSKS
jgi:hypothetical protein